MSNSNKNIKQEMSRNSRHLNAEKNSKKSSEPTYRMGYNSYEYLANKRKVANDAMCNNYMYRYII